VVDYILMEVFMIYGITGGEIYDDTHFSGNTADFLDSMLFWMM